MAATAALALIAAACVGGGNTGGQGGQPQKSVKPKIAKEPKSPVTITFSSWVGSSPQFKKFAADFEKQHPNITIQFQAVSADNSPQKLTTQVAGGTAPDTAYVDASIVSTFASKGALVNVDGYIAGSKIVDGSDYVPGFKQANMFKGSMFGLPYDAETTALFYRKDLFQQAGISGPPQTWDQFKQDADKLTDPAKKEYGFAIFAPESAYYWFPFLWQAGGHLTSDDGRNIAFDSSAGKQAANFYVGLRKDSPPDYYNQTSWDGRVAFATGKVAMYEAGSWFGGQMKSEFPKITKDWGVAPLPRGPAGCATTIGGDSLVVFDQSKNQDAAWKWIEFLSSKENLKAWNFGSKTTTLLPTRQSLLSDPALGKFNPWLKGFAQQMKCAVNDNLTNPNWAQVQDALNTELGKAIYGDQSPTAALANAAKKGEQIYQGANA
jgi:multiple sugar transport system substrate-binding protein